jgi:GMP synthase (glutamine-hydrolysing)
MHIHVIQHVESEGPALIASWAEESGYDLTLSMAPTEEYPSSDEIDFLVVLGGPMDADDHHASPWLPAEKHFVAEAIAAGKVVLGVCLGSQIVAEVIGGAIRRNEEREIGWYPVSMTQTGRGEPLFADWPEHTVVGHWHGDTFDLPLGMSPVLSSEATENQAFVFDGRVVGLQFHLEWDEEACATMLEVGADDLTDRTGHVMSETEFADETSEHIPTCRELLYTLLDGLDAIGPVSRDDR